MHAHPCRTCSLHASSTRIIRIIIHSRAIKIMQPEVPANARSLCSSMARSIWGFHLIAIR